MTTAIFGGSFNPPHVAHVLAAAYVRAVGDVDEVLVVPCFRHPFSKELAPFEDRFRMCSLAMDWMSGVRVSRIEQVLGGESRTLRTLERLLSDDPGGDFRLVMGADVLLEARRWQGFDRIVEIAPLLVLGRIGVDATDAPDPLLPGISSTRVREALAARDWESLAKWLARPVLRYILEHGLYQCEQAETEGT